MNQETAKEKLQSIHESPVDYKVIFSGRKSDRVNGLYKYGCDGKRPEIIIHNRNFIRDDGSINENLLMFTAVHELAHHVMAAEKGNKSSRAHSQEFWATFHDLLDIAEGKGVYHAEIDADTQKLIEEAREISARIADLQRELGRVMLAIAKSCQKTGLRSEDIIERKAQISRKSAAIAVGAYKLGEQNIGMDIQTLAAKEQNGDRREEIIAAAHNGKSVIQAKKAAPSPPCPKEDETESLEREKRRVERTIESLTRRLEEIKDRLNQLVYRLDESA
jgi:chromosome segregation ATPase